MRIGIVVSAGQRASSAGALCVAAETHGLDMVWLQGDCPPASSPAAGLTAAAYVAARTETIRLVTLAPVGPHPVLIAEQAAVADNASNGRLALVLDAGAATREQLCETVEIVLAAHSPRPFRYDGRCWVVPKRGPTNGADERVTVTPKPAQLELPIWLAGNGSLEVARRCCVSHVIAASTTEGEAAVSWAGTASTLGPAVGRLRRPAVRDLGCDAAGRFDAAMLTARLQREAETWGLDTVFVRLPDGLADGARCRAIADLASLVRPQLQMQELPQGVRAYWLRQLEAARSE